jgi:hypothetical protein
VTPITATTLTLLAGESPYAVVAAAATFCEPASFMFFELWERDLRGAFASKDAMTFGALGATHMRVVAESKIVSPARNRWGIFVSRCGVALAAACAADLLARLNLVRSFVTDVAFAVRRIRLPCARHRVTARAIGSLLAAHICRVSLVRKLHTEALSLGKRQDFRLHRFNAVVTIRAYAELRRGELLDVTGYTSSVAGHYRLESIGPPDVTLIALQLAMRRVCEFVFALRGGEQRWFDWLGNVRRCARSLAFPSEGRRHSEYHNR